MFKEIIYFCGILLSNILVRWASGRLPGVSREYPLNKDAIHFGKLNE